MYRLTESLPYLLARVGVRMGELFSVRLERYGLTLPMYRVLAGLHEAEHQRLSDLAAMTGMEISTLSRLVGDMKRRGLLTRMRCEADERTVRINLTDAGRRLVDEVIPEAVHYESVITEEFDRGESKQLVASLRKVIGRISALEEEQAVNSRQQAMLKQS